jgi:hypothetical protein
MTYYYFINLKIIIIIIYNYYTMALRNILNTYVPLRAVIENKDNGKAKIGCVAFSPKLKYQCVLCVWR